MGLIRIALILTVSLASCASGWNYKSYGLWPSQGKLLGDKPENDEPLTKCEPIINPEHPADIKFLCLAMFSDEYFSMKQKFLLMEKELESCKRN